MQTWTKALHHQDWFPSRAALPISAPSAPYKDEVNILAKITEHNLLLTELQSLC